MGFFSRLAHHEPLFRDMADRLGVDFNAWMTANPNNVGDYRTAVLSCTACTRADACRGWLDTHDTADHAPDYCRNRRMLESLAKA